MKSSLALRAVAAALFGVSAMASSAAATKPLFVPRGLAVDTATGDLYVANSGGNNILIYNPAYNQLSAKTITSNVINPTGVAFDPSGNLWVANYGTSNGGPNGSVAEYTNGVQNQGNSVVDGIAGPSAIAIGGSGYIYVQNTGINVTVYGPSLPLLAPTTLLTTITPPYTPVFGIAAAKETVVFGSTGLTALCLESYVIEGKGCIGYGLTNGGYAVAMDKLGNAYVADMNNSIWYVTNQGAGTLFYLGYTPGGIAVDNARGRLYVSDYNGNKINVYTTQGILLHVIQ